MKSEKLSCSPISALPVQILAQAWRHAWAKICLPTLILSPRPDFAKWALMIPLMVLSFYGPLQAEEGSAPADEAPASSEITREPDQQEGPAETVVWPKPFKPSEEIGADSQISFPTDI